MTQSPLVLGPTPDAVEHRESRRGAPAVLTAVLSIALLGALVGVGLFWHSAAAWQLDSAAWEEQANQQANLLAEAQAEITAQQASLDATQQELALATGRITELANDKARLGDEQVVAQHYLDYQERVSEAAAAVAAALDMCIGGQAQLIEYLREPERWNRDDVQRFSEEVERLCGLAIEQNELLQAELVR